MKFNMRNIKDEKFKYAQNLESFLQTSRGIRRKFFSILSKKTKNLN